MLDLADFALQEQPEHSLMVGIFQAWYNGSYTMAAKNQIPGNALYNDPVFNKDKYIAHHFSPTVCTKDCERVGNDGINILTSEDMENTPLGSWM